MTLITYRGTVSKPQITEADIRKHTGDGMVSMENVIDAANAVLKERWEALRPETPGEQKPVAAACADWGQLVQCLLRTMDHPHKGESSTEQAERMATELCRKYPPPPAAGWDEAKTRRMFETEFASLDLTEDKDAWGQPKFKHSHVDAIYEGWRRAIEALRREAPAPGWEADETATPLTYTNYRGETSIRRIIPRSVRYGSTEWHPEPQWLLLAYDVDKKADREFALKDFGSSREAPASSGVAEDLSGIPIGQLFNALLSRINFDGMDPRTFSLAELKSAIDGAEWPR